MPWEELKLTALGDFHNGAEGFKPELLEKWAKEKAAAGYWFFGMGDYGELMASGNRQRLASANLHDSSTTILDRAARAATGDLVDILKSTKGRWMGMLEGNHYYIFDDGTTTDQMLCSELRAPFLGTCGIVQVRFQKPDSRVSTTCDIWGHHGYGSAMTAGAVLNKLHRAVESFEADLYFIAHHHRLITEKPARLYTTHSRHPKIVMRHKILAVTGSFMAGYQQGSRYKGRAHGSYVEQGMMPPTALGAPEVSITPTTGPPVGLELRITT